MMWEVRYHAFTNEGQPVTAAKIRRFDWLFEEAIACDWLTLFTFFSNGHRYDRTVVTEVQIEFLLDAAIENFWCLIFYRSLFQ